jgi:hypothetical protein
MASAIADIETVVTLKSVTLTLDPVEARVLLYLLNQVAGSPDGSARQYSDRIGAVLVGAGVDTPSCYDVKAHGGDFHFKGGSHFAFE